jgi:hypothetical protein
MLQGSLNQSLAEFNQTVEDVNEEIVSLLVIEEEHLSVA